MRRRSLESDIQEDVTKEAIFLGLIPFRLNVVGRKGWPDYGYGYRSHLCFIEFKRPGETPEPLQGYVHDILRKELFDVFVVDNADYGITLLNEWKRNVDESYQLERVRKGNNKDKRS